MSASGRGRAQNVQRLAMFFGDDGPHRQGGLIDIVNQVPLTWEGHCRDIIRLGPALDLHLISANFNLRDTSDPGAPDGDGLGWGLHHALAALARRRAHDAWGNELPLAWELRVPGNQHVAETPDAIRSYGLLRSLAAQPRKGETLPECVWREFAEDHGRTPDVPEHRWREQSAHFIFRHDLAHRIRRLQERRRGNDINAAVARLLPVWRTRLLSAVRRRRCHVEAKGIEELFSQTNVTRLEQDPAKPHSLPIADSDGELRWKLDIFSVFADLARPAAQPGLYFLEPVKPFRTITTLSVNPPSTINEWIHALKTAQGGGEVSPFNLFREAISLANGQHGSVLHQLCKGTGLFQVQKGMVFCFLIARSRIVDEKRLLAPGAVDKEYGTHGVDDRYWQRGVRGTSGEGHGTVMPRVTPAAFARDLQLALAGDATVHIERQHWDWMREGLLDWLGQNKLMVDLARERAPGLFLGEPDDPKLRRSLSATRPERDR